MAQNQQKIAPAIVFELIGGQQADRNATLVKQASTAMLEESARLRMSARGEAQALRMQRYFMDAFQYGKGAAKQVLFIREQAEKRFLDAFDLRPERARFFGDLLAGRGGFTVVERFRQPEWLRPPAEFLDPEIVVLRKAYEAPAR